MTDRLYWDFLESKTCKIDKIINKIIGLYDLELLGSVGLKSDFFSPPFQMASEIFFIIKKSNKYPILAIIENDKNVENRILMTYKQFLKILNNNNFIESFTIRQPFSLDADSITIPLNYDYVEIYEGEE